MQPTLLEGDFVLSSRLYRSLNIGDLVLCDHPQYLHIIKRISDIRKDGSLLLSGDNQNQSVSSEEMGWVNTDTIRGKVIYIVKK